MGKKVWVIIILMLVFVSACSTETAKKDENSISNGGQEDREVDSDEPESDSEEEDSNPAETEVEDQEESITPREPEYEVNDVWSIVPINDHSNEKVVLLTIDDAPDKHALDMAKTLQDLDANAIFFVNGHFLETQEEKEIIKEIYDMGFLIGNHTYSHPFLPDLSEEEQKEEIVHLSDMIEEIIGERPKFFRAPNGANTDYTKQVAEDEGMTLMNWSYGYDWEKDYMSQEAITQIMIHTELLSNGSNLLMHDREWTALALHDIVTGLRDKGYEMVDPHLIKTVELD